MIAGPYAGARLVSHWTTLTAHQHPADAVAFVADAS
jgi:hypothetical protein